MSGRDEDLKKKLVGVVGGDCVSPLLNLLRQHRLMTEGHIEPPFIALGDACTEADEVPRKWVPPVEMRFQWEKDPVTRIIIKMKESKGR